MTAVITSVLDSLILCLLYYFLHQNIQANAGNRWRLKACIMLHFTVAISAFGILITGLKIERIRILVLLVGAAH